MPSTTPSRTIDAVTLAERLDTGDVRVIDVRTPAEFETVHIPGSWNVPLDLLREHRAELTRHLDDDVVLVCRSGVRAGQAEQALAGSGLPGLRVLEGGMSAWEAAGAPARRGRQSWELERQVRLLAGALVATGVAGSALVPRLKWLAGGVGTGLVVAAATNTCALGAALSRMPWNRGASEPDMVAVLESLAVSA
ncbi:rhodanese-like domain-containing protein [Nocardioides aestuarii]|uniref:Rhodanese-like domain-containing protein n=1 Tax=Nocardioides aestuarii TaxID=252231 RepID=A0ABW4TRS7_9ACTN